MVTKPTAPVVTPLAPDTLVFFFSGDTYTGISHRPYTLSLHHALPILTTSASHAAGQTQDITLTGAFGTGAHDIAVQFLDDVYGGSATADRNLYVHQVSLNGHTLAGDAADNHAGYNSGGVAQMFHNGHADFLFLQATERRGRGGREGGIGWARS
ncbi:carbohydrate-binding domain-containing protein [Methylobacterium sp. J-092]|uniref:carbohydrate-binding domain-containing protein n=1 Tax=Methylobacterium sp. J-092 TaxID=2836667 RepID=UPI001FBB4311|nr:carbohydrate-binding domain-containing protein [Methylobacterium sp. J-092]MCJ2010433.1 hypothetical protein [Methylobacterium sp. J-092]